VNEEGVPPVSEQLGGPAAEESGLETTDPGMIGCETHNEPDGQVRLTAHSSLAKATPCSLD